MLLLLDLAITPAQVKLGSGKHRIRKSIIVDNDVDAGELVAISGSTADLADASGIPGTVTGMALNTAAQGQPVDICEEGEVIVGAGAAPVVATAYFLSPNAGKTAPEADVVNPNAKTFVGIGKTGNKILLGPLASNEIVP